MANKKITIQVTSPVTLDNNRYYGRGDWELEKNLCEEIVGRGAGKISDSKVQKQVEENLAENNEPKVIGSRVSKKDDKSIAKNDGDDSDAISEDLVNNKVRDALATNGINTMTDLKAVIAAEDGQEQLDAIDGIGTATIQKLILAVQE